MDNYSAMHWGGATPFKQILDLAKIAQIARQGQTKVLLTFGTNTLLHFAWAPMTNKKFRSSKGQFTHWIKRVRFHSPI
jgi:hypothetical protein